LNTANSTNLLLLQPFVSALPNGGNPTGVLGHYSQEVEDFVPTGLTYIPNAWQKYQIDTVLGGSTATLTVDGVSTVLTGPFGITTGRPTIDQVYGIGFAPNNSTGRMFIDDVLVTATVPTVPGDFDGDNDVDGADFVAWQTNFPKASGATLA